MWTIKRLHILVLAYYASGGLDWILGMSVVTWKYGKVTSILRLKLSRQELTLSKTCETSHPIPSDSNDSHFTI